jgi:Uma2 family endonuclease
MTLADIPTTSARPSLHMSEADYLAWEEGTTHAEWVDGEVDIKMSVHEYQDILQAAIRGAFEALIQKQKLGKVRGPLFRMRLAEKPSIREPDIFFVANEHLDRLGPALLTGPCDLAIEIVAEESRNRDYREKFLEYQAAGVGEYWIIDPLYKTVDAFARSAKTHELELIPPDADGSVRSKMVPGFFLRPATLFTDPLPNALDLMKLLGLV